MFNSIDAYAECGRKAGEARNHHDEALAQFESDYARRMKFMETKDDRDKAQKAFDAAYMEARKGRVW